MENNQGAARAAKRFLLDRVRDDWDWPETPGCWSESDEEARGAVELRERYYGTTDAEFEKDSDAENEKDGPYQFDSPDSIGDDLARKKQTRKRKRRRAQEEEMQWNNGLTCFVARRDAWTGATAVKKHNARKQPPDGVVEMPETEEAAATLNPLLPVPTTNSSSSKNDPADPLIPLAPPLLPDNPIRASIKPKVYSDIYNNIVITGRSPSVPINLADMTRALVHGWKENGEWPPKSAALDPLVGGRKRGTDGPFLSHHPHVKKGMDSVKKIFHLNAHGHGQSNGV